MAYLILCKGFVNDCSTIVSLIFISLSQLAHDYTWLVQGAYFLIEPGKPIRNKNPPRSYENGGLNKKKKSLGDDLLSQGAAPQVPSALTALTTGFEKGPGRLPSHESPRDSFTS